MIFVLATITIKPGSLEQVQEAVRPCIDATRQEPGSISYDLTVDLDNQLQLVFVERWESREHLSAHFETPHLAAWRKAGSAYIESARVEIIHPGQVEVL